MAVDFRSLDRRLRRDTKALHDFLWRPGWDGDPEDLRAALLEDARRLDVLIKAGGTLRRNADALARHWARGPEGVALFELLSHTHLVAAAVRREARGDPSGAGADVRSLVGSVSIGTCSATGCFEYVEEWEGGKTDFEAYTAKVADFLQARGVGGAGQFKRMLNAAWSMAGIAAAKGAAGDRRLAARAAVACATWCAVAAVSIRGAVTALPAVPFKDLPGIIARAASSERAHA